LKLRFLHIILFFLLVKSSNAQNLHFSQFMNSPLLTNPANTGFIPEGDYRLGLNYRTQWSSVMDVPYKTFSAYGEFQPMQSPDANGWLGVGGLLLRDVAGSGSLTVTRAYGSVAYHQMIGYGSLLSLGFNAGWTNKRINSTDLKFPDQFDGRFFDSKLPTSVQLDNTSINYFDIQAGMNYAFFPTEEAYLNIGFSSHHLNRPNESFFDTKMGIDNRVPVRHTAFINGSFKINESVIVNPNAYISLQAKSYEWLVGGNVHYNLMGNGESILIAGLYYRNKDAIIPMIGVGYKDYVATFTYDATTSNLKNFNGTRGAFEFSLIKQGIIDNYNGKKNQTICPSFK